MQYLQDLGEVVRVFRNDEVTTGQIKGMKPKRILISPGPGGPEDAGISCDVIREFAGKIPVLGVCLGHQCLGYAFGGRIVPAKQLMHGKTSLIYHNRRDIFTGLKNPFEATRYHSLVVERESLPSCFTIIAETKDKEIMGLKHKAYAAWGVQFHPESILTKCGKDVWNS